MVSDAPFQDHGSSQPARTRLLCLYGGAVYFAFQLVTAVAWGQVPQEILQDWHEVEEQSRRVTYAVEERSTHNGTFAERITASYTVDFPSYFARVTLEAETSQGRLSEQFLGGQNERYSFEAVQKPSGLVLKHVNFAGTKSGRAPWMDKLDLRAFLSPLLLQVNRISVVAIADAMVVDRDEGITVDGKRLRVLEFHIGDRRRLPAAFANLKEGIIRLDPDAQHVVHSGELTMAGEPPWTMLTRNSYLVQDGALIPQAMEWVERFPGRTTETKRTILDYDSSPAIDQNVFTLSHYGLPEPGGQKSPGGYRTPAWMYYTLAGMLLLLGGGGMWYLLNRKGD